MATKVKAEKFQKINKANLKNASNRTRTGAMKGRNRVAGHSNLHKHQG